jgi:hypothetical protein
MADDQDIHAALDRRVSLMEQSMTNAAQLMSGINTKLDLILTQITRVAILEEKHQTHATDITRAHLRVTSVEGQLTELAKEARAFINYSQGRDKVLWGLGAAVLVLLVKSLFFAAQIGMKP